MKIVFYLADLLQEPKGPPGSPDRALRIAGLEKCCLVDNNKENTEYLLCSEILFKELINCIYR